MIESLPSFLIIPILESLTLKSLGNVLIASKKINRIFNDSPSIILDREKRKIQKIKQFCNMKLWNRGLKYVSEIGDKKMIDVFISKGVDFATLSSQTRLSQ